MERKGSTTDQIRAVDSYSASSWKSAGPDSEVAGTCEQGHHGRQYRHHEEVAGKEPAAAAAVAAAPSDSLIYGRMGVVDVLVGVGVVAAAAAAAAERKCSSASSSEIERECAGSY